MPRNGIRLYKLPQLWHSALSNATALAFCAQECHADYCLRHHAACHRSQLSRRGTSGPVYRTVDGRDGAAGRAGDHRSKGVGLNRSDVAARLGEQTCFVTAVTQLPLMSKYESERRRDGRPTPRGEISYWFMVTSVLRVTLTNSSTRPERRSASPTGHCHSVRADALTRCRRCFSCVR